MNNKIFKKSILIVLILSITCGIFVGCGGKKQESKDKRPSIYISLFNGGYGREWLDDIVNDYNKEFAANKYKLSIRDSKDEFNSIKTSIQSNVTPCDVFIINSNIYQLIDGGYLEDLSSVWSSTPDNDGVTIEQSMKNSELYKKAYSDKNGKIYGIPLQESIRSFVYDHDLFLKYGLLFNRENSFITSADEPLSLGKDGIAGTYDDGHPRTEEEWEAMVIKANNSLGYAFNYTGKFPQYVNNLFDMLYAQYDGVDKYMMNYTLDGSYKFNNDAAETPINLDNGYRIAEMSGRLKALQFIDKYLACKDSKLHLTNPYVYASSSNLSYSHTDAQNDFILFSAQNKNKKIAMIMEGDWWENEAKTTFKALEKENYQDYKFRTRNYKFMTLPLLEGQKEAGNVYSIAEAMYTMVKKQTNPEKKDIILNFLSYMNKTKYLQNFTVKSGGVRPYNYTLTDEQKAQLSPFTRNFLEIYNDKNNKFLNTLTFGNYYDVVKSGMLACTTGNEKDYIVTTGLYNYSAKEYYDSSIRSYRDNWNQYKALLKKYQENSK